MGSVEKHYINIDGQIIHRVYYRLPYSQRMKRSQCPIVECNNKLVRIYAQNNGKVVHLGLYYSFCDILFVPKQHRIFGMVIPD